MEWGTPAWAISIVKDLEPSLRWRIGDFHRLEYAGEGSFSMVVRVLNKLNQDYAVKLLISKDARRRGGVEPLIRRANGREAYVKEWEIKCQGRLKAEERLRAMQAATQPPAGSAPNTPRQKP
jgi:hypothetical protein